MSRRNRNRDRDRETATADTDLADKYRVVCLGAKQAKWGQREAEAEEGREEGTSKRRSVLTFY
jgi:hypothetical protein